MQLRKIQINGVVEEPFWVKHDQHEYVLDLFLKDEEEADPEYGIPHVKVPDVNIISIRYDNRTKIHFMAPDGGFEDNTFEGYVLVGRIIY